MDKPNNKPDSSANQLQTNPPFQTTAPPQPSRSSNRFALASVISILLGLASSFLILLIDVCPIPLEIRSFLTHLLSWPAILFIFAFAPILALIALVRSFRPSSKTITDSPDPTAKLPSAKEKNHLALASIIFTVLGLILIVLLHPIRTHQSPVYLVLSHGFVILGLLLSLRSLSQIKKAQSHLRGKRSSIAAIFLFALWLTFILTKTTLSAFNYINDYKAYTKIHTTFEGPSSDLNKTAIVPTLDTPSPNGKNIIWCSSFQLAWNELKNDVIGEPVQVIGAEALAERLNTAKQSSADLLAESYYIAAGAVGAGIVPTIQSEMAKRFPSEAVPQFNSMPPDWIIIYSYLEAYVKFSSPFRPSDQELIFTDSQGSQTKVDSFGIWDSFLPQYRKVKEQVDILYYRQDPNDYEHNLEFAVDLCKFTQSYQLVVACIPPKATLAQTFAYLQDKIANFPADQYSRELGSNDTLLVPNMFWKITHQYKELKDKKLANPAFYPLRIRQALQTIRFRLDRSGAILKSEARLAVESLPRNFICDRPFLIYLKKRDAQHPFFVMWVDNAELLTEFPSTQPAN